MAFYDRRCEKGHVNERMCSIADRETPFPCPTEGCGLPTVQAVNQVNTFLREGQARNRSVPVRINVRGTSYPEVVCGACAWTDTLAVDGDDALPACPTCGGALLAKMGVGSEAPGEYPRWDRGLGLTLTSAAHRRQVCKERGLTPVDGDFDLDKIVDRIEEDNNAEIKVYDDYVDRLENSQEFKDFRVLRDKGRYDSVLKRPEPAPIDIPIRRHAPPSPGSPFKKRKVFR